MTLLFNLVEVTGFEPAASWSRTKRATNCATPRKFKFYRNIISLYAVDVKSFGKVFAHRE